MAQLWICLHIIAHCSVLQSWWQYDEVCPQVFPEDTSCVSILSIAEERAPQTEALWSRMGGCKGRAPLEGDRVLFPVQEGSSSSVLERELLPSLSMTHLVLSPQQNEGLDYADLFGNVYFCSESMNVIYFKKFSVKLCRNLWSKIFTWKK